LISHKIIRPSYKKINEELKINRKYSFDPKRVTKDEDEMSAEDEEILKKSRFFKEKVYSIDAKFKSDKKM